MRQLKPSFLQKGWAVIWIRSERSQEVCSLAPPSRSSPLQQSHCRRLLIVVRSPLGRPSYRLFCAITKILAHLDWEEGILRGEINCFAFLLETFRDGGLARIGCRRRTCMSPEGLWLLTQRSALSVRENDACEVVNYWAWSTLRHVDDELQLRNGFWHGGTLRESTFTALPCGCSVTKHSAINGGLKNRKSITLR